MWNLHVKSKDYDIVDLNQEKFYFYSSLTWTYMIIFYLFSCMEWAHVFIVQEAQA